MKQDGINVAHIRLNYNSLKRGQTYACDIQALDMNMFRVQPSYKQNEKLKL